MPYITQADIAAHLPNADLVQLTDDERAGVVNSARVDEAIGYADELIDGYLRGRYTLPLSSVPGLIKNLSKDIAVHRLYSRRKADIPEKIGAQFKNALKLLEQIQKGVVSIGVESASQGAGNYKGNKAVTDRVFAKDTLDNY